MRNLILEDAERALRVEEITADELKAFADPRFNRHLFIICWQLCHTNFLRVADEHFSSLENDLYWKFDDYTRYLIDAKLKYLGNVVPEHLQKVYHKI